MPKKVKKLTKVLFVYVRPENNRYVRKTYKKKGYSSYSEYIDSLITMARAMPTAAKTE